MSSSEPPAETLPPGTTLGRYEIRRLIGQGGMGFVYEAIHRDLKKRVALKTLLPALAASAGAKERFFREGEAASRIRHPNVVDVTDVGSEGPIIFLVMEFLEGEDLAALLRQGPLPIDQTADILLPVMAAITSAHEQGVVHRDLKPENIFLATSDFGAMTPKVLDFGISKVLDAAQRVALTGTAVTLGTASYLPPEHLRGSREADARGDQYALGAILYECLTGRRAFDGDNLYAVLKAVGEGSCVPVRQLRPNLPPMLETIIVRAMSIEPASRFESVRRMGGALLVFAGATTRAQWQGFFTAAGAIAGATPAPLLTPAPTPLTRTEPIAPLAAAHRESISDGAADEPSTDELAAARWRWRSRTLAFVALATVIMIGVAFAALRHESTATTTEAVTASPAPTLTPPTIVPPPPGTTAAAKTAPATARPKPLPSSDAGVPNAAVAATVSAAGAAPTLSSSTAVPGGAARPRHPAAPAGDNKSNPAPTRARATAVRPNNAPIVE